MCRLAAPRAGLGRSHLAGNTARVRYSGPCDPLPPGAVLSPTPRVCLPPSPLPSCFQGWAPKAQLPPTRLLIQSLSFSTHTTQSCSKKNLVHLLYSLCHSRAQEPSGILTGAGGHLRPWGHTLHIPPGVSHSSSPFLSLPHFQKLLLLQDLGTLRL